jgi:hypothetical protein
MEKRIEHIKESVLSLLSKEWGFDSVLTLVMISGGLGVLVGGVLYRLDVGPELPGRVSLNLAMSGTCIVIVGLAHLWFGRRTDDE